MFRRRFTFVQASRTTADVEGHDKSARGGLSLIRSVLQGRLTFHSSIKSILI